MRIVIKIGTSTLAHATGHLNIRRVEELCKIISDIKNSGHEVILVSSGAIGMGVGKLGLRCRPTDIPTKQAAAAVGQCELMYTYDKLFGEYHHTVAQLLITGDDVKCENRHHNFSNTLNRLLELGTIPIINENDTISTDEIVIGDNDTLSAIVAESVKADKLILLSDIDGLYTADPHKDPNAKLISRVTNIDDVLHLAGGSNGSQGTGGMVTKLQAAKICLDCGCDMVIANGAEPTNLYDILDGKAVGTTFTGGITMETMLKAAKAAKFEIAKLTTDQKNAALNAMADALLSQEAEILAANAADMAAAKGTVSDVMLDRLQLTSARIVGMAQGIREVAALPDPVGHILEEHTRADGLLIRRVSVPMGVIGIIYESRPNVTSDAAALALKAGSVCILRGGKEAFRSANAIVNALRSGLKALGITENAVNLVQDTSRASATALMTANGYIDLLIPRGGAGLINACVQNATVPCIATGTGICHVYVEQSADQEMALNIIENAKTSRPSVCNAEEVLLVDKAIAAEFLPKLVERLNGRVELRLDELAQTIIPGTPASETDFDTEFLDYILAVKCVENVEEAVAHIAAHSTGHSEAIVTGSDDAIAAFTTGVDSAAVYVNASTRFTDGGEFGLGCEMGISTQKLHARGPMGLRELTTYKYVITGQGHIR